MLVRYAAAHVSLGTDCGVQISVAPFCGVHVSSAAGAASHFNLAFVVIVAEIDTTAPELRTLFVVALADAAVGAVAATRYVTVASAEETD